MQAKLLGVAKIWDAAPHNAFTDLARFKNKWICIFREATSHMSGDGKLRIISSPDGAQWSSAAWLEHPGADLRDAKLCLTPDGRLMAVTCRVTGKNYQSMVLFSDDGVEWRDKTDVADPGFWLWRVTWHKGRAYGVGYGCGEDHRGLRLYVSDDGRTFKTLAANAFDRGYPNETSLLFLPDETCLCLARRDKETKSAQLGTAHPPYVEWTWKDLAHHVGGPHMLRLPDGRILAAGRTDTWGQTALHELDARSGTLTELLQLPSGGDASYPGLVWHDGLLWISYYSSHEQKTSIYLAKVTLD